MDRNAETEHHTQKTQPKKGDPIEIPVPKVSTIRAAIRKVAKPATQKKDESDLD